MNDILRSKLMFQHILVPLDGSARAERAIPVAARIARATGGCVTLLRAVTLASEFAWQTMESAIWQENFEADRARATDYLARIAASEELTGMTVMPEVANGHPAQLILAVADSQSLDIPPVDLIIMCSHGVTGFQRWVLGSVAQHVARHSPVPVLVLNERGDALTTLHPDSPRSVRVLVGLDGSSLAEATLVPAANLSVALSAPAQGILHLARVIPWPAEEEIRQSKMVTAARELALSEARAYLDTVQRRLQAGELAQVHLIITSSVALRADVADTLIGMAETGAYQEGTGKFNGCDMIALATHGRSGLEHWVIGSVAERILGTTKLPLLIVRPPMTKHPD
jgi:nucleotide-binding universal stress UspA family protein